MWAETASEVIDSEHGNAGEQGAELAAAAFVRQNGERNNGTIKGRPIGPRELESDMSKRKQSYDFVCRLFDLSAD